MSELAQAAHIFTPQCSARGHCLRPIWAASGVLPRPRILFKVQVFRLHGTARIPWPRYTSWPRDAMQAANPRGGGTIPQRCSALFAALNALSYEIKMD